MNTQNKSKKIYGVLACLLSIIICIPQARAEEIKQAQPAPGELMLTPEQQAELQAMELLVEEELAKMSPEQKAEFEAASQALAKELEKMKPEELDAFMNSVFFNEEQQPMPELQATEFQPEIKLPEVEVTMPEPEKRVEKPRPTKKHDQALETLNAIINSTNTFLTNVAIMPDYGLKLKKWVEQGKIRNWQSNYVWEVEEKQKNAISIKKKIEDFIQSLHKIMSRDPKSKDYKFLNDLIEDEALINNLNKLKSTLVTKGQEVEVEPFGIEPVSKESRAAMRAILNEYLEALFVLNIPESLQKIFEKYEPTAKAAREQEEAARKKSLEESKKERRAEPTVIAGTREEGYYAPSIPSYTPSTYDYTPYIPSYEPSYPSYERESERGGRGGEKGERGEGGGTGGKGPGAKGEKEKIEKEKGEEAGGGKGGKAEAKEDKQMDKALERFEEHLSEVTDGLSNPVYQNLWAHVGSKGEPDQELVAGLPELVSQLHAVAKQANVIKNKLRVSKASESQKKTYRDTARNSYNGQKQQLTSVSNQIDNARKNAGKASLKKRYMLLGDPLEGLTGKEAKEAEEIKKETKPTKSLFDLQDAIKSLEESMRGL